MSALQQTSLFALADIQKEIPRRQKEVRDEIALHLDMTDKEIARAIGSDINTVTPRRGELVKAGLVVFSQTRPCKVTGKLCHAWRVPRV